MTKSPWRTKVIQANSIQIVTTPAQWVSLDQLESPLPGFLYQLKGRLTKQRYIYATLFLYPFSRIRYVHLQINLTSEDTSKLKQYFEAYSRKQGLIIRHYHADNRKYFRQRIHQFSKITRTNNILMWSQLPLPEENSWKEDQRPARSSKKADTAYQIKMKIHNRDEPVALRTAKRKQYQE